MEEIIKQSGAMLELKNDNEFNENLTIFVDFFTVEINNAVNPDL